MKRNLQDRVVAGVCSGLAEWSQTSTTVVRVLFVLAFLYFGVGIVPYAILWLVTKPKGPVR